MKQILLLTALAVISSTTLNAQVNKRADSARVSYLKEQLKGATGKMEVNILNDLAWEYTWNGLDQTYQTNANYAILAKEKSEKLNYKKGLGFALINISWTKLCKNCDSVINAVINIGNQEKDFRLLARAYHRKWDMKQAYEYFKKAGDLQGEAEAATYLCDEYAKKGEYQSDGFKYCQRAVELTGIKKVYTPTYSKFISTLTFQTMSNLFSKVSDYQTAFKYLKQTGEDESLRIAELYKQMGKYDSSLYYFEKAYKANPNTKNLNRQVGTANLLVKNYLRSSERLERSLEFVFNNKSKMQFPIDYLGSLYVELGETHAGLNNAARAKEHFTAAIKEQQPKYYDLLSRENNNFTEYQKQNLLMDIALGLSKSFYALNSIDSAYNFLQRHVEHRDRVNNLNTLWRLNMNLSNYKKAAEDEKRTSQLQLLQKDNLISTQRLQQQVMLYQQNEIQRSLLKKNNEMKDQQLLLANQELQIKDQGLKEQQFWRKQKESALALLDKESKLKDQQLIQQTFFRNALLAGLFLLLALAVFIIRYLSVKRKAEKLQNEKVKAELEQQSSELEMQALRAQMNPHFIFNCLSSINRFILKNETETASDYLTRFSRLIRMVLINSQKPMIALEDEIDMLRLYLDMERLRFKNSFDYNITYTNTIQSGAVFVPPLLLQPFCENAIWHGLMHKQGQGKLNLNLSMKNNMLQCTITDNGIGRKKSEQLKIKSGEKSKSLGLKITTDRLALLNQNRNAHTFFEMRDLYDERGEASGTEISIKVRYREGITELVR